MTTDRDCTFCGDSFTTADEKNQHEPSCRTWERPSCPGSCTTLQALGPERDLQLGGELGLHDEGKDLVRALRGRPDGTDWAVFDVSAWACHPARALWAPWSWMQITMSLARNPIER
jgi:hypothetical protein